MNSRRIATAKATPKHTIHVDADAYGWHVVIELTSGPFAGSSEPTGRSHNSEASARAAANREYARLRQAEGVTA